MRKLWNIIIAILLVITLGLGFVNLARTSQTRYGAVPAYVPTVRTVSLVVAASDSSAAARAQADYLCASDNTLSRINTAIDALPSGVKGKIILMPGTYKVNSAGSETFNAHGIGSIKYAIRIRSSNVTFECLGNIFINNNQDCAAVLVGDNASAMSYNVNIKLAKVDGNRANNTALTTCSIVAFGVTGGTFEANGYSCSSGNIILTDCTGCTVKGYAYDSYCHNFALEWCTACQMDVSAESGGHVAALILGGGYNYVRATQKNFLATGGGNTAASSVGGVQIYASDTYGNTGTSQGHNIVDFTGYGITTDDCKGVYIYGTAYDPVSYNTIRANINGYRYGVVIEGQSFSNIVTGIISGCAYQGIKDAGYNTIITNSAISSCSQNSSSTYAGVKLSGTKGQLSGCRIGDDGTKLHLAEIELASTSSGYLIGENYLGSSLSSSKGIINQGSNNSIDRSYWDGYTSSLSTIRSDIVTMLNVLGDSRLLLPFYETSGTTVQDLATFGNTAVVLSTLNTWLAAPIFRGRLPYVTFNGTASSGLWIADSDNFTFGNGTTDSAFSIVCVASKTIGSPYEVLIAKDQDPPAPGGREWRLDWDDTYKLRLILTDNSTPVSLMATSTALTNTDLHIIVVTYDGSSTFAGIKMYVDDVKLTLTDGSGGGYVAMENSTCKLTVGMIDKTGSAGYDYWHKGLGTWFSVSAGALSRNTVHLVNQLILSLVY